MQALGSVVGVGGAAESSGLSHMTPQPERGKGSTRAHIHPRLHLQPVDITCTRLDGHDSLFIISSLVLVKDMDAFYVPLAC